jgi:hypothetical protein
MLKRQKWTPDTHPQYDIITEWQWPEPGQPGDPVFVGVIEVTTSGEPVANPETVYETILSENRMKNEALTIIVDTLPLDMKKAVVDSDGDPVEGQFAVKDKHAPVWEFGAADGVISFTIPGASENVLTAVREAIAPYGDAVIIG